MSSKRESLLTRNPIKNMKIGTKIFLLVGVTLLSISSVTWLGLKQIEMIGKEVTAITEESIPLLKAMNRISFNNLEQSVHLGRAISFGKQMLQDKTEKNNFQTERELFYKHSQNIDQEIEKIKPLVEQVSEQHKKLIIGNMLLKIDYELRAIHKENADYQFASERVFNLLAQGKLKAAKPIIRKVARESEREAEKKLNRFISSVENFINDSSVNAKKSEKTAIIGMLSISALILFISLSLGFFILHSIRKPLLKAVNFANQIAAGKRDVKIDVTTKDETGQLLEAMKSMFSSVREAERSLKQQSTELTRANEVMQREITVRKQAEESLQETKDQLNRIIDSSIDMIIVCNKEGRIIRANSSFCSNLGYTEQEVLGKYMYEFNPSETGAYEFVSGGLVQINAEEIYNSGLNMVAALFEKGKVCNWESCFANRSGKLIPVELNSVALFNEAWELFESITIVRDTFERKRMEKEKNEFQSQLLHSEKMASVGQLAAGIAHEINTPTQYIGDNTRFLQESFADLDKLLGKHQALAEAVEKGEDTDDLVSDINTFAEDVDLSYLKDEIPSAIKQSLEGVGRVAGIVLAMKEFSHPGTKEKTPVDINKAIQNTITVARNEWKYVAEVVTDLDTNMPMVSCLPGDINQVFLNMIINAAHAIKDVLEDGSEEKGTITISTRNGGDRVEIRIRDTGTGIPEENRARIFDPFFTTKQVGKGTGQGLAIAHSTIVDKHAGSISVESETGKGTEFIIRLPC